MCSVWVFGKMYTIHNFGTILKHGVKIYTF